MDQQPQAKESVEPLFFRQADFESALEQSNLQGDTAKTPLRPYEVCTAAAKITGSGKIEGAQNVRGTWRLYKRDQAELHNPKIYHATRSTCSTI